MKQKTARSTAFSETKKSLISAALALVILLIIQILINRGNSASFAEATQKLGTAWLNILRNNTYVGIIALGMCLVIVSGGIDISVGAQLCAVGSVVMYLIDPSVGLLAQFGISGTAAYAIAIAAALATGALLGELNGILVSHCKIPAFIVTLGTMKIFRSVTQQMTQKWNPVVPEGFKQIASFKIGGQAILPILYWLILTAALCFLFRRTAFGRRVVAVGSNERAASYSGINVNKIKRRIYLLGGLMCAAAAIVYVARIGSMDFSNAGNGYEMEAIAGVVVGGTAMSGGKGTIIGTFLGVLIIGVINNILNSIGMPTFLCDAFRGAIIIGAVLFQKRKA